jgi:hypothetical protein
MAGDVTTVEGNSVAITLNPSKVNGSNIIQADRFVSNGVIHVIDEVLLPQSIMNLLTMTGDAGEPILCMPTGVDGEPLQIASHSLYAGCIEPKRGSTSDGNILKLGGACSATRTWTVRQMEDGHVMFKYGNDSCAQAGLGESVGDGNIMRITECNEKKQMFQHFMWAGGDGPITVASRPYLCVVVLRELQPTSVLTQSF